jgi:hypothetical protein
MQVIYSFYICPDEHKLTFLETRQFTLAEALSHAVELAFIEGAKTSYPEENFICVRDESETEIFRTPFPKG